jgi:hypothetical protein
LPRTATPAPTRSPNDCVDVEHARQILGGISALTLRRMANGGDIPYVRIRDRLMFKVKDLYEYIDLNRVA